LDEKTKARALEVVREIRADVEADVARWEGKPFTGHNVSTMYGELAGVVYGLAVVIEKMLEE
jgi:hypothetical protein